VIVLDTNVVSELLRPEPAPAVITWLSAQEGSRVYLTAVTEAELRYGVAILPKGTRQAALEDAVEGMLSEDFRDRVLPFDSAAAITYARIAAARRRAGRPISQFDCQIAAIVRTRGATLATRNGADFEGCSLDLVDPWQAAAEP
jgi:predicted nucleic acid-binding protein